MLESLSYYKFIMAALTMIILYVVLRKILFKPVTEFMEKRTKSIQDNIDGADAAKAEALKLKAEYEEQLKAAASESEKVIHDAVLKASQEHDRIVGDAKAEADALFESAKAKIAFEHDQMLKEIRGQVAGLALAAASKVMEANMDTERNRELVDRFIDEAGVA